MNHRKNEVGENVGFQFHDNLLMRFGDWKEKPYNFDKIRNKYITQYLFGK